MRHNNNTLAIFTLVNHKKVNNKIYGYAPYITEMDMWNSHFDKVVVVGNYSKSTQLDPIDASYSHRNIELISLPKFHIKSVWGILKLLIQLPVIVYKIFMVMTKANYIHFRCPSNVSAIAAIVQVAFPKKLKSARYAGNWDPKSKQPIGYRFQKWILTNTRLTKRMKVLVYGEWPNKSSYIQPFFAATYSNSEKVHFQKKDFSKTLKFVFIGALVTGKQPDLAIDVIAGLIERGYEAELHVFGDGPLREELVSFVTCHQLESKVTFYGNQDRNTIKSFLKNAHFSILPSQSEGWPKAIAEAMFFGTIPVATRISCLPWMLNEGQRGILIEPKALAAIEKIDYELQKGNTYLNQMAHEAMLWSQQYTLEKLANEIDEVIHEDN